MQDEDDTQYELKDDDDEDMGGEEAGVEVTLQSKSGEDGSESKGESDILHPRDIDAFWLQRNVSKHCKVGFLSADFYLWQKYKLNTAIFLIL